MEIIKSHDRDSISNVGEYTRFWASDGGASRFLVAAAICILWCSVFGACGGGALKCDEIGSPFWYICYNSILRVAGGFITLLFRPSFFSYKMVLFSTATEHIVYAYQWLLNHVSWLWRHKYTGWYGTIISEKISSNHWYAFFRFFRQSIH